MMRLAVLAGVVGGGWLILATGVFREEAGVVLRYLWALERAEVGWEVFVEEGDGGADVVNTALELKRHGLLEVEEQEAAEVVALEEGSGVVGSAGDVLNVDTGVGVLAVDVTTEAERVGVGQELWGQVGNQVGGTVLVLIGALVPVLKEKIISQSRVEYSWNGNILHRECARGPCAIRSS